MHMIAGICLLSVRRSHILRISKLITFILGDAEYRSKFCHQRFEVKISFLNLLMQLITKTYYANTF